MNDRELCEMFGTTLDEVEEDVARIEAGDLGPWKLGPVVEGRPSAKQKTASAKFFEYELAAIDRAAKQAGITRSAFIRRACDNELLALA